jgi:hypothetical protein
MKKRMWWIGGCESIALKNLPLVLLMVIIGLVAPIGAKVVV